MMITDYHSHILPKMDDGAASSAEALEMLLESKKQGISVIYATPHFYPDRDFPEAFFSRRESCLARLMQVSEGMDVPKVLLGAEVAYYYGIGQSEEIAAFCYDSSSELLVEMPFGPWPEYAFMDIRNLMASGITPVLAHVERYLDWISIERLEELKEDGVKIQCNASFFIDPSTRELAKALQKNNFADYIGSDMHNTTTRPQNLESALKILSE